MRILSTIGLLAALVLVGAGCGNDDSSDGGSTGGGGGGTAQTLKLSADPGGALKFDKSTLTAKAGKATIVLDNPSSLPHAVEVEGQGIEAETDTIGKGETTEVSVDLKPGDYEYYCPVDGHKDGGMEGTLTVQ